MTLFYADEVADARARADAVDLFAGPGGWDVAADALGLRVIGLELDRWACATRRAAGHPTVECNVADVDPADFAGASGLIASPPCQALSNAGNKAGRAHIDGLIAAIGRRDWSYRPSRDARVWLALEVGRWYEALHPEWVALEQVPAALPLWHAFAEMLTADGYSVWTGLLNAADFGVPQTRTRALLIASRTHTVTAPRPTHAKDPTGDLAPWIPVVAVLPHLVGDLGFFTEKARSWMLNTGRDWKPGGTRDDAQTVELDRPAPTLTAKAGGQWLFTRPATTIAGDSRLWPPGHKVNAADRLRLGDEEANERYGDRAGSDAIRLEVSDGLVLQDFPADYPVRGGKSKAFEQIGNAIPPGLARHALQEALFGKC